MFFSFTKKAPRADAITFHGATPRVRHPPTNHRWGYEVQVEDLDGNVLRFTSNPKEGEPFGEWLDTAGGWTRVE